MPNTLIAELKRTATGKKKTAAKPGPVAVAKEKSETVLIGAHFSPAVRRALMMVQVKEEVPRNMRELLGEAINDLCAKYGVPEPYREEA